MRVTVAEIELEIDMFTFRKVQKWASSQGLSDVEAIVFLLQKGVTNLDRSRRGKCGFCRARKV